MNKFWIILGALLVAGVSAYAGGLADAITETAPMAEPAATAPSVPSWVIPAAIVAVLIGVVVASNDDDDDDGRDPYAR
ncbi:hypothetical protein AN191_04545 [Loktanella sp. 5RATIMAR09]|uniref:hypothetical protein n=1 Tax=Loktanella sp. 5RATIMAR09 TaxID=1225655 RepID=UPI0006EB2D9D|nr:hypothetical protein [Loktanella sp. 5RATIMAR09]KQI73159.1 hypothetical protein AN191_04545 [Loktanella sp. 5RATIMAR09]